MTKDEARQLKVGDRVQWTGQGDHTTGTVESKQYGFSRIVWSDGLDEVIGWRSSADRARLKNIAKLSAEEPTP